ncbi:MAG TPA: DUF2752 domain-containing protein [Bacteroidia bacterium]|nr:DUF2752 domain-containing protein [Bacteroidia bacterium]
MGLADWLENHMLSCPYRSLTGFDCPGCGFQRSLVLLLRGEFFESVHLYPALIPILSTFVFLFIHLIFKFEKGGIIVKWLFIFSVAVIVVSYVIHMTHIYHHA